MVPISSVSNYVAPQNFEALLDTDGSDPVADDFGGASYIGGIGSSTDSGDIDSSTDSGDIGSSIERILNALNSVIGGALASSSAPTAPSSSAPTASSSSDSITSALDSIASALSDLIASALSDSTNPADMSTSANGQAPMDGNCGTPTNTYTVKSGDTLSAIAAANGVSLQSLEAANPQISNPDLIYPGQNVNIPGSGSVNPSSGTTPSNGSSNVAQTAESFLGQNASDLKKSGQLPMDPSVPNNVCCANFVSAVLEKAGKLPANMHTNTVSGLESNMKQAGWTAVDKANVKPGDVMINPGHHTEIVESVDKNGKITLVGSNNRNPDGSQKISEDTYTGNLARVRFYTPPN
jgi:spore coat assembly protein SafA